MISDADAILSVLSANQGEFPQGRPPEGTPVHRVPEGSVDCGRSLSSFHTTLLASVLLAALGLSAVLVLLLILSKRIVRPVAESYEKQKRFITAAHRGKIRAESADGASLTILVSLPA